MRKFLPYLKHLRCVRCELVLAICCGILYGASTGIAIPVTLKRIYPVIFASTQLSSSMVLLYCSLPIVSTIIRGLSGYLNAYYIGFCGQYILQELRVHMFSKIQLLQISFFDQNSLGVLTTCIMSDTRLLQIAIVDFFQEVIKQPAILAGTLGFIGYLCSKNSNRFFLVIFAMAAIPCIVPIRIFGVKIKKKVNRMQQQLGRVSSRMMQNLNSAREIRYYGMETSEIMNFHKACKLHSSNMMQVIALSNTLPPVIEVVASAVVSLALYYAYHNKTEPETFISLCTALYLSYEPVKKLGCLYSKIEEGLVGLERMEVLLNEPVIINNPPKSIPIYRIIGEIEFKKVYFYQNNLPVLSGISEKLSPGSIYALIGRSGSGKTTFAGLIPRLNEIDRGKIEIDGVNIRSISLRFLRKNISIVNQDSVFFNDTVKSNILIGFPDATNDQIIDAANKAFAHDFISKMKNGYETKINESAMILSGGQRQRIALARAFLKNSQILILDEAISGLDENSENLVQISLGNLFKSKTLIIIAHHLGSVKHANEVLIFDKGQILNSNYYDRLLYGNKIHKTLYENK